MLVVWCMSVYEKELKPVGAPIDYIITDKIITSIARLIPPITEDSLLGLKPSWSPKSIVRWGTSLLSIISDYDTPSRSTQRHKERLEQRRLGLGLKQEESQAPTSGSSKPTARTTTQTQDQSQYTQIISSSSTLTTGNSSTSTFSSPARPVGTLLLRIPVTPTLQSISSGFHPYPRPTPTTSPSQNASGSPSVRNPGAKRDYYREHTWK
jgi:cell division protein FtsN